MKKDTLLGVFKSKGRLNKEANSKYRSPFQRDRDRIIHSASFRRLKHKTQVFVNTEGDHFRTRITHSIEVAQIARSIAKYLKLNEDLAETLSLAHDLGHTPFGHAGEDALNDCMDAHGDLALLGEEILGIHQVANACTRINCQVVKQHWWTNTGIL